jgi:hypothetical protein
MKIGISAEGKNILWLILREDRALRRISEKEKK